MIRFRVKFEIRVRVSVRAGFEIRDVSNRPKCVFVGPKCVV